MVHGVNCPVCRTRLGYWEHPEYRDVTLAHAVPGTPDFAVTVGREEQEGAGDPVAVGIVFDLASIAIARKAHPGVPIF